MRRELTFAATHPLAQDALSEASSSGLSALGAALMAYFACVGGDRGVLMSPLVLLIGASGTRRALDGRCRQPGIGAKRPRGFLVEQEIPAAAYFGTPTSLLACQVAMSYDERAARSLVVGRGIAAARAAGAKQRLKLLERVRELGAAALGSAPLEGEFCAVAGPLAGGVLGRADLNHVFEVDFGPDNAPDGTSSLPWRDLSSVFPGDVHAIVAGDGRGSSVALAYGSVSEGIEIEQLGVVAPRIGAPVMRGATRLRPGLPLPFSVELRLGANAAGNEAVALLPKTQLRIVF